MENSVAMTIGMISLGGNKKGLGTSVSIKTFDSSTPETRVCVSIW